MKEIHAHLQFTGLAVAGVAAALSFGLILLLLPLLQRYTPAHPNPRSSHKTPTPQGGGIAVVTATVAVMAAAFFITPAISVEAGQLAVVLAMTAGLAVVGAIDDVRVLEAVPRLLLQALAVAVIVAVLPETFRVLPSMPLWLERALLLFGGVWFVNLVNFMDGIDWMTVAEVVPLTAGLALFGSMDALPRDATLVAFALFGAIIGFAPFNRPVARLFLGDVGSLPIGLLLGWLLVVLAGGDHLAAALLLPLYYLADTTITLLRRLVNGEQVLQAHRSHFYQRAMDSGFSVYQIVGRIFGLNIILVGLATVTLINKSPMLHVMTLAIGVALVGTLLWNFNSARR